MKKTLLLVLALLMSQGAFAEVPSNLVVDGVPEFPAGLLEKVKPYFDYRTASLSDFHPLRPEILIRTRFADATQLHVVKMAGGDRKQVTFFDDAVAGAGYRPNDPDTIIFSKDVGGNEFFQLYRMTVSTGAITLLTDGKSRNGSARWSRDGKWMAYTSTKRTGNDTDIYVMDPSDPSTAKMVLQVEGGGWGALDFSRDGKRLLIGNYVSANDTNLLVLDLATGTKTLLTQKKAGQQAAYGEAQFSADDSEIFFTSDMTGEFKQLYRMKLADGKTTAVTSGKWDVDNIALNEERTKVAYLRNEDGADVLRMLDLLTGKEVALPKLPYGTISGLQFHRSLPLLGFAMTSATSPSDVYTIDLAKNTLVRWTESETGGLNPATNVEPELVSIKSFDGTPISGFLYRPDPKKFPGKRPTIVYIHGGPEGQSRAVFLGRNNYWINDLGLAMFLPNVRGSEGYGKSFLASDNGFKREDSVKDIGAFIDWIAADPNLDAGHIAVYGGSYGGYMVLASMEHFADRLKAGIDVVGISDFVTFLNNTSGYRRDLRRVEYGDEREPKMKAHLDAISPLRNASKIKDPLFVIMGFNDPRVPYTEGEQIVKSVRANGAPTWFLMAKDEGHGYAKRKNQDWQFLAMTLFWQTYLLQ
jgi:dipeptidyl aminopeptidase/acylaminoacyl peptidase